MKGRILLFVVVSELAACTSVSDINATQDGHLAVTSVARWSLVSWNHVRRAGVKEARSYCREHHKEMHEIGLHSQGLRGVTRQSVQIVFECL